MLNNLVALVLIIIGAVTFAPFIYFAFYKFAGISLASFVIGCLMELGNKFYYN